MKTADYEIKNGVYRPHKRTLEIGGRLRIGDRTFKGYVTQPSHHRELQDFKSPIYGSMYEDEDFDDRHLTFITQFPFGEHRAPLFFDVSCKTGMRIHGHYTGRALVVPEKLIDNFSNKEYQTYHFARLVKHLEKNDDGMPLEFDLARVRHPIS